MHKFLLVLQLASLALIGAAQPADAPTPATASSAQDTTRASVVAEDGTAVSSQRFSSVCPACDGPGSPKWTEIAIFFAALATIIVGSCTAAVALRTYKSAQDWKRAEFLYHHVKQAESDLLVQDAMLMLDWTNRYYRLPNHITGETTSIRVTDEILALALSTKTPFDYGDVELAIRDRFDAWFWYIERLGHYVELGVVDSTSVSFFLKYWMKQMSFDQDKLPPRDNVVAAIWEFADYYDYHACRQIASRFPFRIPLPAAKKMVWTEAPGRTESPSSPGPR